MTPHRYFITGATGFLGSHVAEACVKQGNAVTTLARSTSQTDELAKLDVTIQRGDLTDPAQVRQAVEGSDVIVHCAAKVGDWGPVEDYRAVNVEGLRSLLEACRGRPLHRFIHISTLGVYAARHHYGTDESEPPPDFHMDGYTQTKVEAEQLALKYQREHGVPVVILRPGFIYGARDRMVVPRLIASLRKREFRYFAGGRYALNSIYVGNVVDAIFLAVVAPNAVGQIYNLTDGELVSKRRFIEALIKGLGLPNPRPISAPLWLARIVARVMENQARRKGKTKAPKLTQARLKFLGLNLDFSIEKAKRELNYHPRINFDRGIQETIAWYKENT